MRYNVVKNADKIIDNSDYLVKNPSEYKGRWKDLFKNNNPNFAIVFANGSAVDQDLIDYLDANSIPYSYS